MQFHSEGGLELLSRFSEKPHSINLDEILFPNGVSNESVIEIGGASSTGKTLLLCQFLAKCVLPASYKGIKINGCDASAILIDTLGHIRISKVAELMTFMICSAYQAADVQKPSFETIDSIVCRSLENLSVINCCNNDQFKMTVHTLEEELLSNERVVLLAVDSILTYYWRDRRENGIVSMDSYAKNLIQIIRARTSQFRTVTVYTRWDVPESKSESHVRHANLSEGTGVNYRLQLYKSSIDHEFVCYSESTNNIKQVHYTICNSHIKWIL